MKLMILAYFHRRLNGPNAALLLVTEYLYIAVIGIFTLSYGSETSSYPPASLPLICTAHRRLCGTETHDIYGHTGTSRAKEADAAVRPLLPDQGNVVDQAAVPVVNTRGSYSQFGAGRRQ